MAWHARGQEFEFPYYHLASPRLRVVVITNVPHAACFALEVMHPCEPNATPPILLHDGFFPRVVLPSCLEALAVLSTSQIGHSPMLVEPRDTLILCPD